MRAGRVQFQTRQAASVCAVLGTILNMRGKTYKPSDFLPKEPARISAKDALKMLRRKYVK